MAVFPTALAPTTSILNSPAVAFLPASSRARSAAALFSSSGPCHVRTAFRNLVSSSLQCIDMVARN